MKNMFASCESLTELDLSGWDLSALRTARSMFENCEALTDLHGELKLPEDCDTDYMYEHSGLE